MDTRKLGALAAAGIAVVVGLAVSLDRGGSSDVPGSYRSGYYATRYGASYQAGGAAAGWDTLLSVYSTRTGMGDTIAVANAVLDTFNARWHAKKAAASSVVRWGSDDPTFAYAAVDTQHLGVSYWPTAAISSRPTQFRWRATGTGGVTWPTPTTARWAMQDSTQQPRQLLVHFDPKLPAGVTIVSAKLHFYTISTTASSAQDTIVATLMTAEADSVWWRHKGINDNGLYTLPNMSKASYAYQWYATAASPNYGYTNVGSTNTPVSRWDPALDARKRWWDWGAVSDWTRFAAGFTPGTGDLPVDVTNCVQAIVNGETNNGIMITRTKQTTSDRIMAFYNFDQTNTSLERCYVPWLEIKYITKKYRDPFPGGRIALLFQSDDGLIAYNDSLTDAFLDHGGRFSIFVCDSLMNLAGMGSTSETIAWHDAGMEIGTHSRRHRAGPATEYLTVYEKSGISAAKLDSLRNEMNPEWLYLRSDSASRQDLRDSPRWGKSMALPGYPFSATVINVAAEYGYNALRVGTVIPYTTVAGDYRVNAAWRPAASDTARAGMSTAVARAPRNVMLLPLEMEINMIVGKKANTTADEDSVKHNFRKLVRQLKAQNRPALSLYEHNFKSGAYANGIDPEEIRWILQVADEEGMWIAGVSEYSARVRAGSTAIATPVGYAQPDSFRFEAADRVWYKPHGVDNRWIPGVK